MTVQEFSHQFFTFGLIYATFFSIFLTIRGILQWMGRRTGAPIGILGPPMPPAVLHGDRGERAVDQALREAGTPTLRNVFIHLPGGGLTEVDVMALVGAEILVIEVKAWAGRVLGEIGDEEWTQQKSRGISKVMKNPLHQNQHHVRAVRTALPKARCVGVVVFTEAVFSTGHPNGVVDIPALLQRVADGRKATPDAATMLAWGKLSSWSMGQDKQDLHDALVAQIHTNIASAINADRLRTTETVA